MPLTRTKRKIDAVGKETKAIKTKESVCNANDNQLKVFKVKYQNLLDENKRNLEIIKELKGKVAELEKGNKESTCQESQTLSDQPEEVEIPCKQCIVIATCEEELNWHMNSEHSLDSNCDAPFSCNICGRNCQTKNELMAHRKVKHPLTIKICRYFIRGECRFGDDVCWYSHQVSRTNDIPQTLTEFKCSFCGEVFKKKSDFMKHRKVNHSDTISECINDKNGYSRFYNEECWFRHGGFILNNPKESISKQTPEILEQILSMMEKFKERFEFIENQL